MPYIYEQFEYVCPDNHKNRVDFVHAPTGQSSLPAMLPCSGCNYKLVATTLVLQQNCDYSESDFAMYTDQKYVESAAYHEAAHAVIAFKEEIPLNAGGIRIDRRGNGFSHYKTVKLTGAMNVGSDPERERAIRSTQAGYIAQEKFYKRYLQHLPSAGSSSDTNYINGLLEEMYSNRNDCDDAKTALGEETRQRVEKNWQAIEALAQALWKEQWKSQAPASGERRWSLQFAERKLDGSEVAAILDQFGIKATIQPARRKPLLQRLRLAARCLLGQESD